MSVRIHLNNPHNFYTNLDFISGKVVLSLTNDETVQGIVVKLEGESKTILIKPPPQYEQSRRDDRNRIATENHKILYKVQQVFPDVEQGPSQFSGGGAYTLRAGQHEYPFRFKIPFNNSCSNTNVPAGLTFGGIRLMDLPQQLQYRHVQKSLPPSLSGFPGEAEIRYYVKVTVQRPGIFKENRRSQVGFKFTPIEPIRPPPTSAETFARRPHAFKAGLSGYARKSSMFKKSPQPLSDTPPSVLVDARLPNPAILTCNESIPLRVLVKKMAESPEIVYLLALQIDLIGHTYVRAQDVTRTETNTWVVMSLAGLARPVGSLSDPVGTESLLDSTLWDQVKLPHTVTPSFDTCNLTRAYELEVRVTLGYGHPNEIQPQTALLPLRFPVQVYSGIAPPPALVEAMVNGTAHQIPTMHVTATSPISQPAPPSFDPAYPPQLGTAAADAVDEAPPSYEDAMADEIAPVDGPRRDYSGVTNENGPSEVGDADSKSGNSGRLFPGSGPGPAPKPGR